MSTTLAVGTHEVRVVDHYLTEVGTKKTPAIVVVLENDRCERISWTGWLSEATVVKTFEDLEKALGWDSDADNYEIQALNTEHPKLAGRECQVVVEEEEYEGRIRNRARWLNPKGYVGGPSAIAVDAAKALSTAVRAKILTARGPRPSTAPSRAAPAPARPAATGPRPTTAPAARTAATTATLPDPEGGAPLTWSRDEALGRLRAAAREDVKSAIEKAELTELVKTPRDFDALDDVQLKRLDDALFELHIPF